VITVGLEDKTAKKLADLAGKSDEQSHGIVKISSNKGGEGAVYNEGEKIFFYMQVKKPLFVYLYDFDPRGGVELLYPDSASSPQSRFMAGKLYTLPAEHENDIFRVKSPFGMDAIKIFASTMQLPLPVWDADLPSQSYQSGTRGVGREREIIQNSLARHTAINPVDLVDYYRGLAALHGVEIYEDTLMIETRKN